MLSEEKILSLLDDNSEKYNLVIKEEVSSTNTILKELAKKGARENTVLIANHQTEGRGRLGRSFFSPSDTGIYMSILFFEDIMASDAVFITTSAAVAVARAIEKISGKQAGIKWVNDIFIDDKKVCGILTEAQTNPKSSKLDFVVLGIGVNVHMPKENFPAEIKEIASFVTDEKSEDDLRNILIAEILNNVWECISDIKNKDYLKEYRQRSVILGKEIYVLKNGEKIKAVAIGIDDEAGLVVEYDDKTTQTLSFGEVSVTK